MAPASKYLFGGDRPWDASRFTASDDRVRGGKSQSYLTVLAGPVPAPGTGPQSRAHFSGHLDTQALGGAGFASQRTVDDTPAWDLAAFDTLVLDVDRADGKKYTLTLKDETLPRRPDGRDQSSVSWEYDFTVPGGGGGGGGLVAISFAAFQPTYRGRPKPDAKPLDLKDIKRISFMMRSFFGEQEGDFSLVLNSVSAEKRGSREGSLDSVAVEKLRIHGDHTRPAAHTIQAGATWNSFTSWISKICS